MQNILDSMRAAVATLRSEEEAPDSANLSVIVQVNTASQKAIQKMERKAHKRKTAKQATADGREAEFDYVRTAGWAALQVRTLMHVGLLRYGTAALTQGQHVRTPEGDGVSQTHACRTQRSTTPTS